MTDADYVGPIPEYVRQRMNDAPRRSVKGPQILEGAGVAAIVTGAVLLSLPYALLIGGVLAIVIAVAWERRSR